VLVGDHKMIMSFKPNIHKENRGNVLDNRYNLNKKVVKMLVIDHKTNKKRVVQKISVNTLLKKSVKNNNIYKQILQRKLMLKT
jgi:hypothetical protein